MEFISEAMNELNDNRKFIHDWDTHAYNEHNDKRVTNSRHFMTQYILMFLRTHFRNIHTLWIVVIFIFWTKKTKKKKIHWLRNVHVFAQIMHKCAFFAIIAALIAIFSSLIGSIIKTIEHNVKFGITFASIAQFTFESIWNGRFRLLILILKLLIQNTYHSYIRHKVQSHEITDRTHRCIHIHTNGIRSETK